MPRIALDLNDPADLAKINAQWRVAEGFIPGEPNEGLIAKNQGSPARFAGYDDSGWEVCDNIRFPRSTGFTFAWYRLAVELPAQIDGVDLTGYRVLFEASVDNYAEVWVDGQVSRVFGVIVGIDAPHRLEIDPKLVPGARHLIPVLAVNGPLAEPLGGVWIRYANLAFELRDVPL